MPRRRKPMDTPITAEPEEWDYTLQVRGPSRWRTLFEVIAHERSIPGKKWVKPAEVAREIIEEGVKAVEKKRGKK